MQRAYRVLVLALSVAACADRITDPSESLDATWHAAAPPAGAIRVLTRNMYVGTNVDAVIAALVSPDPSDDLPTLLSALATLEATNYPARARALAAEIARLTPDVVGLQEVSQVSVNLTPLGIPIAFDLDFLPVFEAELAAQGLRYAVGASNRNIDASPIPGIRLVDFDVLLVNLDRVTVHSARSGTFAANIGVVAPGVELRRGWVLVDATVGGEPVTVLNTHLEAGDLPGLSLLRAAQAQELATVLGGAERAVILGDLNDVPGSPMTQVLAGAGLVDVWAAMRGGAPGFTCCHADDLSNRIPALDRRLDYVLARGMAVHPRGHLVGSVGLVGARPSDQTATAGGRLWPSDHAGVHAALLLAKAR